MSATERQRVLFISSNGTGLGHLTRSMAIARRLDAELEPLFVSLSAAAPVVEQQGFEVEYIASHATPTAGSDWRWSRRLRGRLRTILAEAAPRVVVFDGAHPYQGLCDALAGCGAQRVWSRRPMWLPGSNAGALGRAGSFDHVLEPGEVAAPFDRGATVERRAEAELVDPIVLLDDEELLPREQAERELGLEPGRVNVLVSLGQGEEVREAASRCLAALARHDGVQVAALSSALAELDAVPDGVVHLRATYPMSRYLRAFDAAVSAAGYNAYHELVRFGVPTLFVPMARRTDDQAARARWAEHDGIGLALGGPGDERLEERLGGLLEPAVRERLRARLAERRPGNGAAAAARWIAALAACPKGGGGGGGAARRGPLSRLNRDALRELPRMAAAIAYQSLTRPAARTLVVAAGAEPARLAAELDSLVAAGERPERILVVTDSLAQLGELRRRGVGVEHVPGPRSRAAELSGLQWDAFLRARLAAILAERPRPRRLITLGERAAAGTLDAS